MAQLLSNLPLGAKIKFGKHQINKEAELPIIWMIVDKNHNGYPANAITLITERIIDIRPYDAQESSWTSTESPAYGYIDYKVSNINQWLNSAGAAGAWYTKQHDNDRPPSSAYTMGNTHYDTRPGFLYYFTESERDVLLPTTLVNQHGGSTSQTLVAKVFLPSLWETIGTHGTADGSSQFAYFTTNTVRALPTAQLVNNTLADADSKPTSVDSYWSYLTRSTDTSYVGTVNGSGARGSSQPRVGGTGVRPCINLPHNAKISDSVDADGCYTVLSNVAPTFLEENSDLGEMTNAFSKNYTISDTDGDIVTVTEYVDNVAIRSYVLTSSFGTIEVKGSTWLRLSNGNHTLKIVATDGFSETIRTFTFVKNVTSFTIEREIPIPSETRPKSIIVTVVRNIPVEAEFKVYACNDGFDAEPTWEDITDEVVRGEIHDFTNETKDAKVTWGVNIRVTVNRNGAVGACYITEIGGNFE